MRITFIIILGVLFSCSPSGNNELVNQSKETHQAAIKLGKTIAQNIVRLEEKTAASQESILMDSLDAVKKDFSFWNGLIAESPGIEHDHDDHEGHDHHHGQSHDLTPEMILDIQKDLYNQAQVINKRIESLLEQ